MELSKLLKNTEPIAIEGEVTVDITGVNIDSRRIQPGHLFVAIKGTQVDGHSFIKKAEDLGAVAVLCEDMPTEKKEGVTYVQVPSTEDAVGLIVNGYAKEVLNKLPMEFAVEAQKLLSVSLEGSVG